MCSQGSVGPRLRVDYFLALEDGINQLPGFTPEIQGVYITEQSNGYKQAYGYVLKKEY